MARGVASRTLIAEVDTMALADSSSCGVFKTLPALATNPS